MRTRTRACVVLLLTAVVSLAQWSSAQAPPDRGPLQNARAYATYASLPLTFEANQGQAAPQVKFLSRGKGYSAFLTAGGMVLSLRSNQTVSAGQSQQAVSTTLQFKLVGAAQNPAVIGEAPQRGIMNYFIGNDPAKWHTNVPTYARVRYKNVYPGIDLVYYGNPQQLEYDFAIAPGTDAGQIQFEITGASQIELDAEGNLVLQTGSGELHFQSPEIYQENNGLRMPVSGGFVVNDATHVAFQLASHDASKPLVIDPTLVYSTYLGGVGNDQATGIAVDSTGNVYIAGYTDSADFLLTTIGVPAANTDHVFVAKLNPTGSSLVYADYIGGNNADYAIGLALDSSNNVYVTGSTTSSNFPTVNPYQAIEPGSYSGFVSKISANGSSLLYSTYLGGNGFDQPAGIAVDSLGEAYIAGTTTSTNFPTANAYQNAALPNQGGLYGNYGFVTKFAAAGSSLIYSTYLTGNTTVVQNCGSPCWPNPYSAVSAVALDANGNAYLAGTTNTSNFPATSGAYLASNSPQPDSTIGFVSKLASSGGLDYSTYFYGSSGNPVGIEAIAVDSSGSAYIAGTVSADTTFPITSDSICNPSVNGFGCSYAFVSKFDPSAATLLYSTFLGPNNYASPQSIALDSSNHAYVVTNTNSAAFETTNAIEGYANQEDVLLVEIDASATTQLFATYLGGSGNDFASGITLDASGNIYIVGSTYSADFPVTQGAFHNALEGGTDGFVVKIGPNSVPAVALSPGALQYAAQAVGSTSPAQTGLLRNMGSSALSITAIATSGDFAQTNDCGTSVPAAGNCTFSITFSPTAPGSRSGSIEIQDDATGSPHVISLSGSGTVTGPFATFTPTGLSFSNQQIGTSSAAQIETLTNSGVATLSITGIQITGDFAQTNNCSATLAPSSSCTVNITFTPTVSGIRNGILTVNDNESGSPQTASLTGSGSDFTLISAPSSDTVQPGSTANYNLTVSSVGGTFSSAVKLTCGGLPAQTSCSLSPGSVTPGANGTTSTLSITTSGSTAQMLPVGSSQGAPLYAVWIPLPVIGLFALTLAKPKRSAMKPLMLGLPALMMMALVLMTACAGGTGIAPTGTAPGTYTITVTGASGNLQHTMNVTLVVQ